MKGWRKVDADEALMENQSQLAEHSLWRGREKTKPFLEWEERIHMGKHDPGKMNECFCPCLVHWALGWNLWFMIQFHASLQRAEKAVQGIMGRAQTPPTQLWHIQLNPLRRDGPCTQSWHRGSQGTGPNQRWKQDMSMHLIQLFCRLEALKSVP